MAGSLSGQNVRIRVRGEVATLVNIEYPGRIVNPEKAMKTLGGVKGLSQIYRAPDSRLPLRYRPDDIYCKPAYATSFTTNDILLNVKQKRNKKTGETKLEVTLVGIIDRTYKFNTMMDYQYLTMERVGDSYRSLEGLSTINKVESLSWMENGAPLHFMPSLFSPADIPYAYHFREEDPKVPQDENLQQGSLFGTARKKRATHNQLVNFEAEKVPLAPNPGAEAKLVTYYLKNKLEEVKKKFDERPVWTRAALSAVTQLEHNRLKVSKAAEMFIVTQAWNSVSGPWRTMWVKHGYDPRKHVEAKHHQLIDYRYRQRDKLDISKNIVLHKRSYAKYFSSITKAKPKQFRSDQLELIARPDTVDQVESLTEEQQKQQYMIWPGIVPPYRQLFYQICDIQLPEVQEIVNSNNGKEPITCHKLHGFLVEEGQKKIRAIINKYVDKAVKEIQTAEGGEDDGADTDREEAESEGEEEGEEAYPDESSGAEDESFNQSLNQSIADTSQSPQTTKPSSGRSENQTGVESQGGSARDSTSQPIPGTLYQPTNQSAEGALYQPTNQPIQGTSDRPTHTPVQGTSYQPTTQGSAYQPSNQHTPGTSHQPHTESQVYQTESRGMSIFEAEADSGMTYGAGTADIAYEPTEEDMGGEYNPEAREQVSYYDEDALNSYR